MQYFAQEPLPLDSLIYDTFARSRKISPTCVDLPPSSQSATPAFHACIGLSTLGNSEVDNEDSDDIVVSDPQGWLIVPSDLPADINFVATTIGSFTSCRNGTQLCDLAFTPAYTYNYTYNCKRDIAGLDLVANMSTADDGPVLVYYADSTMNTPAGDIDLQGPTLWYAVLLSNSRNDGSEILACSTELSDVVRCLSACTLLGMLTRVTCRNTRIPMACILLTVSIPL